MATESSSRGPKHRNIEENETFSSLCSWINRMKGILRKDSHYVRFLVADGPDSKWKTVAEGVDCRGLTDDAAGDPKVKKEVKLLYLTGMLEEIAEWTNHWLEPQIINESTSIEGVWDIIRSYFHYQQTEVQFISLLKIQWEGPIKERPEHLYRRIMGHIHDNLLKKDGKLQYLQKPLTKNEEMTPTIERLAILHWLQLIDTKLPQLVVKTFSNELQTKTLKDIQPQISSSIDSLLEELKQNDAQANFLQINEEIQASRVSSRRFTRSTRSSQISKPSTPKSPAPNKTWCRLCRAEGRRYVGHSLANCGYIASSEKRDMVKTFKVEALGHDAYEEVEEEYDGDIQNLNIEDE